MRNSIIRSTASILGSIAAIALWAGCASDQVAPAGAAGAPASAGSPGSPAAGAPATPPAGGAGSSAGGAPATGGSSSGGSSTAGAPAAAGAGTSPGGSSSGGTTGSAGGGSTNPSGAYNPDFVEFVGKDCVVSDPAAVDNAKLPDLFKNFDGTRMTKKSDWKCRRAELKKAVEKFIHGEKPGRPEKVTGTVSATSIKVHVENGGKSIDFSVAVSLPSGASGPVPAIIGLGGGSLDKSIVSGEGVASINYDNNAMSSESSRSGLFSTIYGSTGASAQVGWAWGVSRIIDVLVDEKTAGRNSIIDPTGIGITGCSRLGKGAFTIGAFDERIALGIPQESGTGGVSAFRVVNTNPMGPNGKGAQSLDSAWSEAQGWFGTAFGSNRSKVNTIPADTHSLVAMYAPRGLLVLDNSRIGELCATCQHAATADAAEVYKALGVEKNIEYNGGNPSDPHNHCTFYAASQGEPLKRAIRAFLTKKAAPDGRIAPAAVATADLTKWIEGTTPTLE
ncbi:MAG: cellulose-binding protein [Pseudomonadota bacterium]